MHMKMNDSQPPENAQTAEFRFKRLRRGRAIRSFVKNAVGRALNVAKRVSSRQAA